MRYAFCTSFSPKGYEEYGREFLESFVENSDQEIFVYFEGERPDFAHPQVYYIDLLQDPEHNVFMKQYGELPAAQGIVGLREGKPVVDYRYQCTRFAHKVYALTAYPTNVDWWVWVDADVVVNNPLDDRFFDRTCGSLSLLSYLGRQDWDHSECGFVAYRVGHPTVRAFMAEFRRMYTSGEVFKLAQWHDSFVFDVVRDKFRHWRDAFVNLSNEVPGNHVWPQTILGEYMTHNKGPALKKEAYGE